MVLICLIFSVLSTIDQYEPFANATLFWMVSTDSNRHLKSMTPCRYSFAVLTRKQSWRLGDACTYMYMYYTCTYIPAYFEQVAAYRVTIHSKATFPSIIICLDSISCCDVATRRSCWLCSSAWSTWCACGQLAAAASTWASRAACVSHANPSLS